MTRLKNEKMADESLDTSRLQQELNTVIAAGIDQLRNTRPDELSKTRELGRKKTPTTVIGLLFHAAEHASRHCGQIITTLRLLQSM